MDNVQKLSVTISFLTLKKILATPQARAILSLDTSEFTKLESAIALNLDLYKQSHTDFVFIFSKEQPKEEQG